MFFSISKQKPKNFFNIYEFDPFTIGVDNGWQISENQEKLVLFKGYADEYDLSDLVESESVNYSTVTGNFCLLIYSKTKNTIEIKSDRYRSFPVYLEPGKEVTNLYRLTETVYTDNTITINKDFSHSICQTDIIGEINQSPLSANEGLDIIDSILEQKTKNLLAQQQALPMAFRLPIKVFLSGGVDSLLVYSYLQKHTNDYSLVKAAHVDYTDFWLKNSHHITSNWAYKQIHHWAKPTILSSGAPGDEFMMRSPGNVNLWLLHHNTNLNSVNTDPKNLHYSYFNLQKHQKLIQEQSVLSGRMQKMTKKMLQWYLCNMNLNDWQHHHIENTLTWTPLRDLEIYKTILRMPYDTVLGQILDSKISKALITRNNKALTGLISDQKNSDSYMSNLIDFYRQHP